MAAPSRTEPTRSFEEIEGEDFDPTHFYLLIDRYGGKLWQSKGCPNAFVVQGATQKPFWVYAKWKAEAAFERIAK